MTRDGRGPDFWADCPEEVGQGQGQTWGQGSAAVTPEASFLLPSDKDKSE